MRNQFPNTDWGRLGKKMKLDLTIRDYQGHLESLRETLEANGVVIYLDTCTLLWLVRIATAARNEFIDWCCSIQNGEVIIPVWAAHEFHHHIAQKSVASDTQKRLNEIEKSFKLLKKIAIERADNSTCEIGGFSSREVTVNQVASTVSNFSNFKKALLLDDNAFAKATNEVAHSGRSAHPFRQHPPGCTGVSAHLW